MERKMRTHTLYRTILLLATVLSGCNLNLTGIPPLPVDTATTTQQPAEAAVPSSTPNPFPNPILKVTGAEEVVFDWTTDRCEKLNIIDLPARVFRDAEGQTQLILSHFVNYRMVGPDLDHLKTECNLLLA